MPVAEPSTALNLWPRVRALSGWPDTDEDAMRALGEAWLTSGEGFVTAGQHDTGPVTGLWSDIAGQAFVARANANLGVTFALGGAMTVLGERAQGFAQVVTDVKNGIRDLIEQNLTVFALAAALPPGVRELAEQIIVSRLASMVNDLIAQGVARVAALGGEVAPDAPEQDGAGNPLAQFAALGADALNHLASLGNAALNNPGLALAAASGVGVAALGVAGVTAGGVVSLSGVGAIGGVPLAVASYGAIAVGSATTLAALGGLHEAAVGADKVTPIQVNSDQSYYPAPRTLPAVPDAVRVKKKTPVQGGGALRDRWKDRKGRIYEWDRRHGEVEVYDKNGNHTGSIDPDTGEQLRGPVPGRKVEK